MIAIERNSASILPALVIDEKPFCVHTLAQISGYSTQTVKPVLDFYENKGWTLRGDKIGHGNWASHYEFTVSEELASDVSVANEAVTKVLNKQDVDLYLATINARNVIPYGHEADSSYESESIKYLGGIAILSIRNDLASISSWTGGQEGWESLVTLQSYYQSR